MGTLGRATTSNGQKCCDSHSPFKNTVHKEYHFPCSTITTQIARRRIGTPMRHPCGGVPAVHYTGQSADNDVLFQQKKKKVAYASHMQSHTAPAPPHTAAVHLYIGKAWHG